jgi:hypothetical protein
MKQKKNWSNTEPVRKKIKSFLRAPWKQAIGCRYSSTYSEPRNYDSGQFPPGEWAPESPETYWIGGRVNPRSVWMLCRWLYAFYKEAYKRHNLQTQTFKAIRVNTSEVTCCTYIAHLITTYISCSDIKFLYFIILKYKVRILFTCSRQ